MRMYSRREERRMVPMGPGGGGPINYFIIIETAILMIMGSVD